MMREMEFSAQSRAPIFMFSVVSATVQTCHFQEHRGLHRDKRVHQTRPPLYETVTSSQDILQLCTHAASATLRDEHVQLTTAGRQQSRW